MRAGFLRVIATGAVLALALGLGGCASDEEQLQEHLAKAEEHLENNEIKLARIELLGALDIDPQDPDINFRLAKLARRQANFADALFFFRETYRLDPSRVDARMEEAGLLLGEDLDRARDLIEKALEEYPDRAIVHRRHAELALMQGDSERALTAALTAIELAPDQLSNYQTLGIVHQARIHELRSGGKEVPDSLYQEAIDAFDKAGDSAALVEKARVYSIWPGHDEDAEAVYRELAAKTRERKLWGDIARIGTLAWRHAQTTDDIEYQRWALEQILLGDDSRIPVWEALAALEKRAGGSAEEVMQRMLEERPDDIDAHLAYSNFLARTGDIDGALTYLEGIAEKGIEPAAALSGLMARQLELRRMDDARATLEELRKDYAQSPLTRLSEARMAMVERRYAEAEQDLKGFLDASPTAEAWSMLAIAQLRLGELSQATAAINRALELAATPTPRLLRIKATVSEASKDWISVVQTLNQLRRTTGEQISPTEQVQLARALYGIDRPQSARALLINLFESDKPPPVSAVILFSRRESQHSKKRAYRQVQLAYERRPDNPLLLQERIRLEQEQGKPERALELLNEAIEKGPVTPVLLNLRARTLFLLGEYEQAEQDARRAFEARPDLPGGMELLVAIYTEEGRTEEVIESFEQARKAGVLPVDGSVLLARLYLRAGRVDDARKTYESVLSKEQVPLAMNDLAYILADQNRDLDRALELAQQAQQVMGATSQVADTLGYVYYRRGIYPAAMEQLRYAIELAEDEGTPRADYHYHLGLVLRATGEEKKAIEAFEKALAVEPDFADADALRLELSSARAALEEMSGPS